MPTRTIKKQLFDAIHSNNLVQVEELLAADPGLVDVDYKTQTPLTAARSVDLAKLLLERGAAIDRPDKAGHTPLYFAVLMELPDLVEFLLAAGADPNAECNDEPGAIFRLAVSGKSKRIVESLLAAGATYETALHACAFSGNKAILKCLLETGKWDVNERDHWKDSPLSIALKEGFKKHREMADLLREHGAKTNRELGQANRKKRET